MSNIALLITVVLSCFLTESAAGGVHCRNPIEFGELRVLNSKLCVDIAGNSGTGSVGTWLCDGYADQKLAFCGDGTIRNLQAPQNCLTEIGTGWSRKVESVLCRPWQSNKWIFGRSKAIVDKGGIKQEAREMISVRSGHVLDVAGRHGHGRIGTYKRDGHDDQLFYFRSRGRLVGHGRLQIQKSGLCLNVAGTSGGIRSNVLIWNCRNVDNEYFLFYENGELVSKMSGLCVDIEGRDGSGNILMYPCEDEPDQMWIRTSCHGSCCSFVSKRSKKCLEASGSNAVKGANILAYACDGRADQRFRWVKTTPRSVSAKVFKIK